MTSLAARRLVFSFGPSTASSASGLDLIQRVDLLKQTPPNDDVDLDEVLGAYLELRGPNDLVLYRIRIFSPLPIHTEVFAADGTVSSLPVTDIPEGTFRVIVPDIGGAEEIVLLLSPEDVAEPMWPQLGIDPDQGIQEIARWSWDAGAYA